MPRNVIVVERAEPDATLSRFDDKSGLFCTIIEWSSPVDAHEVELTREEAQRVLENLRDLLA